MKRLVFVLAFALCAVTARAADDLDVSRAAMYNSPADFFTWPATAQLTSVQFDATGNFVLAFDKQIGPARWPDFVPPGWDGPLQYTVGMCLAVNGSWACSAVVEYWNGRGTDIGASGGDDVAGKWFYDGRWGPLAGRGPKPGERVALFVCAADCRNVTSAWPGALHERSDVRLVSWGVSQAFTNDPAPPPPPPPPPPVPPPPQPPPVDLTPRVAALEAALEQLRAAIADVTGRVGALEARPMPTTCRASLFGYGLSCSLQ